MRIRTVTVEGFQSWRDRQTVDLTGLDLVAVVGQNHSGKSSLINAVTWAIWGTGRGGSVNDVIHRGSQLARVTLVVDLATGTYRITRTRTVRGRHEVLLSVADPTEPTGWRNLAEKHSSATDGDIVELVGMDVATARLTWLIGQGDHGAFCEMKPTDRRTALAEAFGLGVYADLARAADDRRRAESAVLERATWEADRTTARADEVAARLDQLGSADDLAEESARAWDEVHRLTQTLASADDTRVATARAELDRLRADHRAAVAAHTRRRQQVDASLAAARGTLDRATTALERATAASDRVARLETDVEAARQAVTDLETRSRSLEQDAADARAEHADAGAQSVAAARTVTEMDDRLAALAAGSEGGRCIVCRSELTPQHAADLAAETTRARDVAERARTEHEQRRTRADQAIVAAVDARRATEKDLAGARHDLAATERDLAASRALADTVEEHRHDAAAAQAEVDRLTVESDTLGGPPVLDDAREAELVAVVDAGGGGREHDRAALERARDRARTVDAQVAEVRRLTDEQATLADDLGRQQADVDRAREVVGTASVLVDAFRPSGIPSMVLAGVVDELNAEANAVMDATGDDGLGVRVSTRRATAKGTSSEQVMVYATTAAGDVDYATLSGSEKFRVALAVRLGLSRCVARRTGTPVRTIVLDEGWGALDEPTRRGVAAVLGRLAGQFGVLTVSHVDDVKDSFPHLVVVDAATGTSVPRVVAA